MESHLPIPLTRRKEDNLIEVTNVQLNSKPTHQVEKIKDRDNSSVKVKRVSFHIAPAEKNNLKINTIQNIYNPNAEVVNDETIGSLTRSNSLKNRINKSAYLKLHRHSLLSTERSSVGKLKGKYENIAKQTDNSLKPNSTIVPTKPNTDNISTNNTGDLIDSEEDRLPNERNIIKEESTLSTDHSNASQPNSSEDLSNVNKVNESQERHEDLVNDNEVVKNSTDYFLKTTTTIEKLQNNLTTKLSKETIAQLRSKYSPANYGKSITTKKFDLHQEHSSKLPIPTPRALLTPVLPSKFEKLSSETPATKEIESLTVKLVTLDDACQQVDVDVTKNEIASPVLEKVKHENTKSDTVSVVETKIKSEQDNEQLSDDKNNNLPENELESNFETLEVTYGNIEFAEPEARHLIVRRSSSEDSINKVESFLSQIIMEKRPKEKKRSNSFRKLAAGFFGRDKKKSDGDKVKHKKDNGVFTDNAQNESQAFDRHSSHRHTTDNSFTKLELQKKNSYYHNASSSPMHYSSSPSHRNSSDNSNLRGRYTEMNGTNGALFKSNRTHIYAGEDYVPMDSSNLQNSKNVHSNYINVGKHGDTSSSSSNTLDSENRNCTYQNALIAQAEMRQIQINENLQRQSKHNNSLSVNKKTFPDLDNCLSNDPLEHYSKNELEYMQLVKPKALIPINSERPLPNPYHNNHDTEEKFLNVDNGKTIDRNLNNSNSKPYPYKNDVYNKIDVAKRNEIVVEEVYGTVFDNITPTRLLQNNSKVSPSFSSEHSIRSDSSSSCKSQLSPKSVEASKLKLPSNRQKIDLQPRIRSPLPQNKVSTDKIIATELLRNSKSPTRNSPILMEEKRANSLTQLQRSPQVSLNRQSNFRQDYNKRVSNRDLQYATAESVDSFQYSPSTDSFATNLNSPVLRNRDNQAGYHQIRISDLEQNRMSEVERNRVSNLERNRREFNSPSFERSNITTNAVIHKNPEERISSNCSSLPTLSRGVSPQQMQKPMYFNYDKSPSNASLNSSLSNVRSYTPTQKLPVTSSPKSPEKQHIINNVEAFYWRELKKLKHKEEQELSKYRQNQFEMYGYAEDPGITRRSRSVSPSLHRGQRSLSLPRDGRGNLPSRGDNRVIVIRENGIYSSGRLVKNGHEVIPEGRPVIAKQPITLPSDSTYGQVGHPSFQRNPHFVRNTFERSTIGPIGTNKGSRVYENYYPPQDSRQNYTPIFKRGSLTGSINVADSQLSKKVSFNSTSHSNSIWPTKNGFTRSPPTRRIERESMNDDEVFLPNSPRSSRNAPENNVPSVSKYGYANSNPGIYYSKPDQSVVDYGGQVQRNLSQQDVEPIYGGRQKQITVSNRVCDIYGKIHDADQKPDSNQRVLSATRNYGEVKQIGLVYGQLQPNTPNNQEGMMHQNYDQTSAPSHSNFVRGTRLTASANDMYKRYPHEASHYQFDERYQNETPYSHEKVSDAPNRPLPPIPHKQNSRVPLMRKTVRENVPVSNIESGSETDKRVYYPRTKQKNFHTIEEEWNSDGKLGRGSGNESGGSRGDNEGEIKSSRSRSARREDPRRHTLSGDQHYGMSAQGGPLSRTMDLEGQFMRGYPPSSNAMLFDDDPGIMSEVETSSTGFRRGGKQRSSLPVVRTPSKTLERPLGLVFLQYRNETKRALLPNEITSIDTVKALFVRSFPKQLSMEYLDSPLVKIYIHDSSKDMFYELEDVRSHLREIRDRSVLRLFESTDVSGGLPMGGVGIPGGVGHFEDPSYFSEPEFDSEYQHQHIHKSKGSSGKSAPYYMGSTSSLPRGGPLLRPYSPAVNTLPSDRMKTLPAGAPPKPQRAYSSGATRASDGSSRSSDRFAPFQRPANPLFNLPDGYMSSPERGSRGYEDPYYSQYTSRSGSITPVIDEEISDTELLDEQYSLYGVKIAPGGPRSVRPQFPGPAAPPYDATRLRVEHMERQLANLTGLVQKALTQTPAPRDFLAPPGRDAYRSGDEFDKNSSSSSASLPDDSYLRTDSIKAPKLGKSCHKSVSFEKSVSFSDEPPDMNSPKQHSPQHTADTKPPKPAIKSSTLPRTSSQEKDRLKPAPPPKPASLSPGQYDGRHIYRDLQLTPEMYNQLRGLQKKAKDLRADVRNLRRMSQAQAHSVRETIRDTFIKIRAMLVAGGEQVWQAGLDQERVRLSRDEDLYKQEMLRLEKDLTDLEGSVEELRGNVINRKTRVNMSDVENMALVLSKSSKTVADLKLRFPGLQDTMKSFLTSEMDKVVREEKFLKEEPERLESALRRCKKLTGTLVTLKRLASVQEQRLPCATGTPDGRISPTITETPPVTPTSGQHSKPPSGARVGQVNFGGDSSNSTDSSQRPENALDALLDELQTFSKPHSATVNTQMPQAAYSDSTPSDPPAIPVKGIPPSHSAHFSHPHMAEIGRKGSMDSASILPTQNLTVSTATGSLRRLHSYPSGSDTDNSPPIHPPRNQLDGKSFTKPPIPERNAELLHHITSGRRVPPPPPPRTSSKSPLASPTSPSLPPRSPATGLQHIQNVQNMTEKPQSQFEAATQNLGLSTLRRNVPNRSSIKDNKAQTLPRNIGSNLQIHTQVVATGTELQNVSSSSCESVNSQDGTKKGSRKEELEQRHQELLKKQKALQEQYARLQQLQRGNNTLVAVVPPTPDQLLKKTGSESNLLQKMGLQMSTTQMTGSLTNLPSTAATNVSTTQPSNTVITDTNTDNSSSSSTTTSKVYETDIL